MQLVVLFLVGVLLISMGGYGNAGSVIAAFVAADQLVEG